LVTRIHLENSNSCMYSILNIQAPRPSSYKRKLNHHQFWYSSWVQFSGQSNKSWPALTAGPTMFDDAEAPFLPIKIITFPSTLEPNNHLPQTNTTPNISSVETGIQLYDDSMTVLEGMAEQSNRVGVQVAPTRRYTTVKLN